MTITPVVSATDTQTTGITESDALIWAEMMTETSTQCMPPIIVRCTMGFVGLYVRLNELEN